MNTRVKFAVSIFGFILMTTFYGYLSYKAAPELATKIVAYNHAHPLNWVDVGLGAVITFITMTMIFVGISLFESIRFEREFEKNSRGPGGSGGTSGGGNRKVRIPMSRKIISIDDFRKAPPINDRLHRGFVEVTT